MMPQQEGLEAIYQQADPAYGSDEGTQIGVSHHTYEQGLREGPSGKDYPLPRDNTNLLRFAMVVIALFGLLFGFVIGGTTGWVSLAVVCFAIIVIAGVGIDKIH